MVGQSQPKADLIWSLMLVEIRISFDSKFILISDVKFPNVSVLYLVIYQLVLWLPNKSIIRETEQTFKRSYGKAKRLNWLTNKEETKIFWIFKLKASTERWELGQTPSTFKKNLRKFLFLFLFWRRMKSECEINWTWLTRCGLKQTINFY
jgi:hypothetical protein